MGDHTQTTEKSFRNCKQTHQITPFGSVVNCFGLLFLPNQESVERLEEKGLIVERILVLIRNVLHVPSNPDIERRPDNDASLHDQVLWSLQQAGILDLILYIIGSEYEIQYHLHAMEIICLMYREQVNTIVRKCFHIIKKNRNQTNSIVELFLSF